MTASRQFQVVTALAERQAATSADIEKRTLAQLSILLSSMRGKWYDDQAVAVFAQQVASLVRQAQVRQAQVTVAFLTRVEQALGYPAPSGFTLDLPPEVRRVDPAEEWQRPAKTFRRLRVAGLDELKALEQAEVRAQTMARMDLALARREASRQRIEASPHARGYRRIIHPELAKHGSCGLCVVASDRVYKKSDLLPLHDGCNCTTLPILGDDDPGLRLNTEDLGRFYEAAGSTAREDLQRTRVTVNEHGELGPVLTRKGDHFRDLSQVEDDLRS